MNTLTAHDLSEWSRMATDAYRQGWSRVGHIYSAAATLPTGHRMTTPAFDSLQSRFRAWLTGGKFPATAADFDWKGEIWTAIHCPGLVRIETIAGETISTGDWSPALIAAANVAMGNRRLID